MIAILLDCISITPSSYVLPDDEPCKESLHTARVVGSASEKEPTSYSMPSSLRALVLAASGLVTERSVAKPCGRGSGGGARE